jgi:hypothetical protein
MIHPHHNGPTLHTHRLERTKKVKTKIRLEPKNPKPPANQREKKGSRERASRGAPNTDRRRKSSNCPTPDWSDKGNHKMRKKGNETGLRIKKAGWKKNLAPETPITPIKDAYNVPQDQRNKKKRLVGVRYSGGRMEGGVQETK